MASDRSNSAEATPEQESTAGGPLRKAVLVISGSLILTIGSLVMLVTAVLTLFQTRRFCAERIARTMGYLAVRCSGVRMVVHRDAPLPNTQTVYISNHTSTLDVFVTTALGLPNTRYFLSGFLRKILPLGLIGYLIGVFWTAPLRFPEKRRKIFQRADRILRRTGESVYLTPEGARIRTGEIGHFNRGAFHLATSLGVDIVPIYIHIAKQTGAGLNLVSGPGRVDVYFLPTISTAGWSVDELDQNRDRVRKRYVEFHAQLQADR